MEKCSKIQEIVLKLLSYSCVYGLQECYCKSRKQVICTGCESANSDSTKSGPQTLGHCPTHDLFQKLIGAKFGFISLSDPLISNQRN